MALQICDNLTCTWVEQADLPTIFSGELSEQLLTMYIAGVHNTNEHRIRTAPLRNGAVYYKEGFACLIYITQGSN
nr:MAG TPA: hypothetical protein [Caudoviricetes sp.]